MEADAIEGELGGAPADFGATARPAEDKRLHAAIPGDGGVDEADGQIGAEQPPGPATPTVLTARSV